MFTCQVHGTNEEKENLILQLMSFYGKFCLQGFNYMQNPNMPIIFIKSFKKWVFSNAEWLFCYKISKTG